MENMDNVGQLLNMQNTTEVANEVPYYMKFSRHVKKIAKFKLREN